VLVAGHDTVIPARFGRRLFNGFAGQKRLWEFPEDNHGTVMVQPPEVWKKILDFCRTNEQVVLTGTRCRLRGLAPRLDRDRRREE
jgi:hypothetical protein